MAISFQILLTALSVRNPMLWFKKVDNFQNVSVGLSVSVHHFSKTLDSFYIPHYCHFYFCSKFLPKLCTKETFWRLSTCTHIMLDLLNTFGYDFLTEESLHSVDTLIKSSFMSGMSALSNHNQNLDLVIFKIMNLLRSFWSLFFSFNFLQKFSW